MHELRSGSLTLRPATRRDDDAVSRLWNARSQALRGQEPYDAAAVRERWEGPSFSLETDTLLVFDEGDSLVGYAHVRDVKNPPVDVFCGFCVHPAHDDDEGLWRVLLDWADAEARRVIPRAPSDARIALVTGASDDDSSEQHHLEAFGFEHSRTFVRMTMPLDGVIPASPFPEGISVRPFVPGEDDEALVHAYREAFRHHYGHLEEPFESDLATWRRWMADEDFDPALWFVAFDKATSGEVVGFCCCYPADGRNRSCGLIDELGVRPAWRRRGMGRALLTHALRALQERGLPAANLRADFAHREGAIDLYTSVGMRVEGRSHTYVKELRPGRNLVAS